MNRFESYMEEIRKRKEKRRIEEEERLARQKKEEEERKRAFEKERRAELERQKRSIRKQIENIKRKKQAIIAKMRSTPAAGIHFNLAPSTIRQCMDLQSRISAKEREIEEISEDTGFFKQPWFFWLSFALSLVVSFLWINASFGTDVIGGSELKTSIFIIMASLCLDLVFFVFVSSILILLEKVFAPKSYVKLINIVAVSAGLIGLVTFLANLFFRIMEV